MSKRKPKSATKRKTVPKNHDDYLASFRAKAQHVEAAEGHDQVRRATGDD